MKIQIEPHTLQRAKERGTNENEIKDAIKTGFTIPEKHDRSGKAKIYDFKRKRNIIHKSELKSFMLLKRT